MKKFKLDENRKYAFDFIVTILYMQHLFIKAKKAREFSIDVIDYYIILEIIHHNNNEFIQKDFAQLFDKNESSITRALNHLEKSGYIERILCEDNKSKLVKLSPTGRNIVLEVEKEVSKFDEYIFSDFSPENVKVGIKNLIDIANNSFDYIDNI